MPGQEQLLRPQVDAKVSVTVALPPELGHAALAMTACASVGLTLLAVLVLRAILGGGK